MIKRIVRAIVNGVILFAWAMAAGMLSLAVFQSVDWYQEGQQDAAISAAIYQNDACILIFDSNERSMEMVIYTIGRNVTFKEAGWRAYVDDTPAESVLDFQVNRYCQTKLILQ